MSDRSGVTLTGPFEGLVERYGEWLVGERCLAVRTIEYYVPEARRFLALHDGCELGSLTLGDVTTYVVGECRRCSYGRARSKVTALRSLLRYLYLEGVTDRELAPAVPGPTRWRYGGLPLGVRADELAALVAGCDVTTAIGCRDHAIVVMLVRLGLRAGEVAALSLDDVDWIQGELLVRGKGNHSERLPLPVDVGEAVVAYLRDVRPSAACRTLFLRMQGPSAGLSATAIGKVVQRVAARAGVAAPGAHRLRHSAATAMLQTGASLDEVGQVLRQRTAQVTAHYAKVDFARLRPLALRWPERVA
jgi:integrase/recombinase XerD